MQLSFSQSNISVNSGEQFTVDILLDTEGASIDGVDVIIPLQGLTLVNFQEGSLMPQTIKNNTVDKIMFSQIVLPTTHYTGSGVLATLTLTATTNTTLAFDFTLGSTIDTNIISNGSDILSAVSNLQININNMTIDKSLIGQNLRILAQKQRDEATYYEIAADLQDNGYQSDQAVIDSAIQADKDARQKEIDDANATIADLQNQLVTANDTITVLQTPDLS